MNNHNHKSHVVIIGAGFAGLTAAYEISRHNIAVTVLEKDDDIGGLGSSFKTASQPVEKFYHHWFKNDEYVTKIIRGTNYAIRKGQWVGRIVAKQRANEELM